MKQGAFLSALAVVLVLGFFGFFRNDQALTQKETFKRLGVEADFHGDRAQLYAEGAEVLSLAKQALALYSGDQQSVSNIIKLSSEGVGLEYAPSGPDAHKPVLAAKEKLESMIRAKGVVPLNK